MTLRTIFQISVAVSIGLAAAADLALAKSVDFDPNEGHQEHCLIVGVTDGDTMKARCGLSGAFRQVTIRLAEVDAPESSQAFGQRAKVHLASLCYLRPALVSPQSKDRYGRTVARVECSGQDASQAMVAAGMAWRFTRYSRDPEIQRAERQAREAHIGLWQDSAPTPPWEFRKSQKRTFGHGAAE